MPCWTISGRRTSMKQEVFGLPYLVAAYLLTIVSAQNFSEPVKFEYYTANLNEWCGKKWNNRAPCEKNGATFGFATYPKKSCTVTLAIPDCADGSLIETHGLFFNIRSMALQNNDSLKLYESNENLETKALLLSFTSKTGHCKQKPDSCGQLLGAFAATKYYQIVFESSGETTNERNNSVRIDTTNVYRSSALEGRLRLQSICEPGNRVNCPSNYTAPTSPSDSVAVHSLAQGYSWSQWQHYCATEDWALTTTLAPGPTSIAPIESVLNYMKKSHLANYSTIFLDHHCGEAIILPCEHDDPKRAGTLRFQYAKLPRSGLLGPKSKSGRGDECTVTLKVNSTACVEIETIKYGIYLHFKAVKLTPSTKNPKVGDSLSVEDDLIRPPAELPKWNVLQMSENPDACSTKSPMSCGVYVTPYADFSQDPYVKIIYKPDEDDGVPGFADRVLVDYIVLTNRYGEPELESECPALKGFMPNRLMCETRNRVNCPAEGIRALKETYKVDKLDQGHDWYYYNELCSKLGFPQIEHPKTTTSKPVVQANGPNPGTGDSATSNGRPTDGAPGTKSTSAFLLLTVAFSSLEYLLTEFQLY